MAEFKVTGEASVTKAYDTIAEGAQSMPMTQQAIANLVVGASRGAAPRRSGALAGSIGARVTPSRVELVASQVYAGVQEWGWRERGIRGRHYLAAGIMSNQQGIVELYAAGLTAVVAKAQVGE